MPYPSSTKTYPSLGTLGPILWDFAKHTMAFKRGAKRVLWRGIDTTPGLSAAALSGPGDNLMDALLEEFAGLFAKPHGLPPRRHLSHRIRLKPGVSAVAVRSYRYAHTQKDELERQCDEMLRQGVIRPSSSAFSLPALLIRKPDGTWRFCVDYRAPQRRHDQGQVSHPGGENSWMSCAAPCSSPSSTCDPATIKC